MGTINTQFTVPCTSDRAILMVQDVVDSLKWPVLEVGPSLVVIRGPAATSIQQFNLPVISLKLSEQNGHTDIAASISMVGPIFGEKKRLTGILGQIVNSLSLRAQTESIAINPTVALGEGQGTGSQPQATDRISRLMQLKELRDSGVLTDDEFAAEKARIFSQD